jgi:hypothetical protein
MRMAAGAAPPQAAAADVAAVARALSERIPQLLQYSGETIVVKYGGHAMTDDVLAESFYSDVVLLRNLGVNVVIVHGGGPQVGCADGARRGSADATRRHERSCAPPAARACDVCGSPRRSRKCSRI